MKRGIFLYLLMMPHMAAFCQFTTIAEGPSFDEPGKGFLRIVQMKNGNTAYLYFTFKDGLDIQIYDKQHKQVVKTNTKTIYEKIDDGNIDGIFEINGDAVILISEMDGKHPVLYRIIVNGETGQLKQEELSRCSKLKGKPYTIWDDSGSKSFIVRKDLYSDNYAVLTYNKEESNGTSPNEIVHYGSNHQVISRATYATDENEKEFFLFRNMVVLEDQEIWILGANINSKFEAESCKPQLAILAKGKSKLAFEALKLPKGLLMEGGIIRYNPVNAQLALLATLSPGGKQFKERTFYLSCIDRQTHNLAGDVKKIFPAKADAKSKQIFEKPLPYVGTPQNMFVGKDGSVSVVFEEIKITFSESMSRHTYSAHTVLGNIAVLKFDQNGKEINTWLLPKAQFLPGEQVQQQYHNRHETEAPMLTWADEYKSFFYVTGINKDYVLFNDPVENTIATNPKKWNLIDMGSITDVDGAYYTLTGNDILPPAKQLLFGKGGARNQHYPAMFNASGYDPENNIIAALQLDGNQRRKTVRLVWLKAE